MPRCPALLALALLAPGLPAQTFTRATFPAIGRTLTLEYASNPGNSYLVFGALPPGMVLAIPGIGGTFRLNPAAFFFLYLRQVPPSGTDPAGLPLPNDPVLAGLVLDFQALDVGAPATYTFSSNAPELTLGVGLGTATLIEGPSAVTTTGTLQAKSATNATAGAPAPLPLASCTPQVVYHHGWRGFVELAPANQSTSSSELTEPDVDCQATVVRDARDSQIQCLRLPNGFNLFVFRDTNKRNEFFLAALDRGTGAMTELTGSRVADTSATATPASNYRTQLAFTRDGAVGAAIVHDSTSTPTPNVGPPDRVVLFHTDPARTWGNGRNVLDVSPAGAQAMHAFYNGTLRFAHEVLFVEGEDPGGVTGEARLLACPSDGSGLLQAVAVPNTGTGQPFYWSRSEWRVADDGRTMVFPYAAYGGGTSTTESDIIAVTGISKAGPLVARNITAFPAATAILGFGLSAVGSTGNANNGTPSLRGALSPDGRHVAFTTGLHTAASPAALYVAPTDGSLAGSLAAVTAGSFDPQVVQFCELAWLDNNRLLFLGLGAATASAAAPAGGDFYVFDRTTNQIANLTQTTTGAKTAPFTQGGDTGNLVVRGSFRSRNGLFHYFLRTYPFASTAVGLYTDIKGINALNLKLFDVTGTEFSPGPPSPSLRPAIGHAPYDWMFRRAPATDLMYLAAGRDTGQATSFTDDDVWAFDPEQGTPAFRVTAYNGTGANIETVQRIKDLRLSPDGRWAAFSRGIGTSATTPEDLFVVPAAGGTPIQLSVTPPTGGQGIRRGSVFFTLLPPLGVVWAQGNNSRTTPTGGAELYWNSLAGRGVPLRISAPALPSPQLLQQQLLNWSPLNP